MSRAAQREVKHLKIISSSQLKDEFEFGEQLGEGSFGSVLLAVRKADREKFAVKKMAKQKESRSIYGKSWEIEIQLMRRFQHENLIKLEVIFESENNFYLFLEYCDAGTLSDEMERHGKFRESDARCLLRQLGSAINFLHRHRVVHRDLKPQNCLLKTNALCSYQQQSHEQRHRNPSQQQRQQQQQQQQQQCPFQLRLTDFGLSIELKDVEHVLCDNVGTPMYQAPEIVNGKSYTFKCDVWSFGIVFYWMLHGCVPYKVRHESDLQKLINEFDYPRACSECNVCSGLTQPCRRALTKLLVNSQIDRWSASEFMASCWITETEDKAGDSGGQSNSILDMMREFNAQMRK